MWKNDYRWSAAEMDSLGLFKKSALPQKDIEMIRRKKLGKDTPWDAIWGESHGALIAQKYAYKYGTGKVKKLILVGPPSRSDETHDPRRKMTVSNLEAILTFYRNNTSEGS